MRVTYYPARLPIVSPAYAAFRDRVVADGGAISNSAACQRSLLYVADNPQLGIYQWLDSRFGVKSGATKWYSICGAAVDVTNSPYQAPVSGVDTLTGGPVWAGGAFASTSPKELSPSDSYSWGMRYYQTNPTAGYFFGNRYGGVGGGEYGGWLYFADGYFQSRFYGGYEMSYSLPHGRWAWVWLIKDGDSQQLTIYDDEHTVLATIAMADSVVAGAFGIGGGTLSDGVTSTNFRYERFIRATTALTAAQRAAIQAL